MRVAQESAWILHRRAFRESSFLLDVLSAEHGRFSLVARAGRKAGSSGLLQALRPLKISYQRRSELGTLTGFEADGLAPALRGQSLWCGFYLNELLMRLLPADDGEPELIFDLYGRTVHALQTEPPAPWLRQFEYGLLSHLGYALDPAEIETQPLWTWNPERGLQAVTGQGVSRDALLSLLAGRHDDSVLPTQAFLGLMLQAQLGAKPLQSSQMLRDLVSLSRRAAAPNAAGGAASK